MLIVVISRVFGACKKINASFLLAVLFRLAERDMAMAQFELKSAVAESYRSEAQIKGLFCGRRFGPICKQSKQIGRAGFTTMVQASWLERQCRTRRAIRVRCPTLSDTPASHSRKDGCPGASASPVFACAKHSQALGSDPFTRSSPERRVVSTRAV